MTDMYALALRVAVLKALQDRIVEASARARSELLAAMTESGAERVKAALPEGTKVASVVRVGGDDVRAHVVDEAAFLDWVRDNRPSAIEERVRSSDRKALLDELTRNGEEIPGVQLGPSSSYVTSRFVAGGREHIERAWTAGALTLGEVLAIEAPEVPDASS